ncbi:MAG TPA: hypothetical protein DCS43_08210 [Verrucomicrobia bacterium]|nr:hypothetical protein [Verrucomicrobiota bacterium]
MDALDKGGLLKALAGAVFLLLLLGSRGDSIVFTSRSAEADVLGFLQSMGGQTAYQAPVRINGADATLTVVGLDDPDAVRASQIRAALLPEAIGEGDALSIITRPDRVTRLLVFRPGDGGKTLVVLIEQTPAAFRQSREGASRRQAFPLSLYPGSTVGLQAENKDTGVSFATLNAVAAPEQVSAYYASGLRSAGWLPMFPGVDSGADLYLRENALCFVIVTAKTGKTGESHITLLHKSLKNLKP